MEDRSATLRRLLVAGLFVSFAGGPAAATASTAQVTTGSPAGLVYNAAVGETNQVTVSFVPNTHWGEPGAMRGTYTIVDTNAGITSANGCATISVHEVTCVDDGSVGSAALHLGDQNDSADTGEASITPSGLNDLTMYGEDGDDTLKDRYADGGSASFYGGAGNDHIQGQPRSVISPAYFGTNLIHGGSGDDTIVPSFGPSDVVNGDDGTDTVDYTTVGTVCSSTCAGVEVSLDDVANDGPSGASSYAAADNIGSDVENLVGSGFDDTLVGGGAADSLDGGAGDDDLEGLGGADLLAGGPGLDAADFSERSSGVTVHLDGQPDSGSSGDGPAGARDTIETDVEGVYGGSGDDMLVGNDQDNGFDGGPGADTVVGGSGEDAVSYIERTTAITVHLDGQPDSGNSEDGVQGARDTISADVEDIYGGDGPDVLDGSTAANYLFGGGGSDVLDGGSGSDSYVGDLGDDTINARNGITDASIDCGSGGETAGDIANVDDATTDPDSNIVDCETVNRPPPASVPSSPSDTGSSPTTVVAAPSPTAPSNQFTFASPVVHTHRVISVSLRLPGPGEVTMKLLPVTFPRAGRKPFAHSRAHAPAAGRFTVRLTLSRRAQAILRRTGRLKIEVDATYMPDGGSPSSKTKRVTLRGSHPRRHR